MSFIIYKTIHSKYFEPQNINYPFPKRQILDSFELKEFAHDKFKFDEKGKKFSKQTENTVGKDKLLVMSNFSFSHSVFKGLVLQTRKNQGLFGKGLGKLCWQYRS